MYLNCKTNFSFKYGTYGTEELVLEAAEKGIRALALTNINNTCDAWDFVDFCHEHKIKPVVGTEIRNEDELMYILLAKNNNGFFHINRFLSLWLQAKKPFPGRPDLEDVLIVYPFARFAPGDLKARELIGVQSTEVNKLFRQPVTEYPDRYVVLQPVVFQEKFKHYYLHRLLRAVDKNILLDFQQPGQVAEKHASFVPAADLFRKFELYPSIVTNTLKVLDSCSIELTFHTDKTKQVYGGSKEDDKKFLAMLARDGMQKRYGSLNKEAQQRVLKELEIINNLGFNAYFLITWDILRYAKSRGFFYVGRGSGANSIVAYCLEITDVEPIQLDLYFERFLNPYRSSPLDFDMDFSWKDRDEIIDYIFKRYGTEYVSLLGSYNTFQHRAAVREFGKVYGLPPKEIDNLEESRYRRDQKHQKIFDYGRLVTNFPHHLSIHAGGVLISDKAIHQYTATELPPKNFPTSQIDMFIAEKIGLFKLDILSQRGLGNIKDAVELVRQNKGVSIDIFQVEKFKKDRGVAAQLKSADTIGCFYIESPGMRQLLKKLRCEDYLTLVAASSIIRPGVSQSGMMKQYIYRFHNPDKFEYLHPKMEELLKETYGVMVYQEDVIKIAHHFGKLDMGEADVLRRAMSGKYRGHKHFEQIRAKYFANCKAEGYPDHITNEVWRQIESFGGYSFSKAHSASFAVESYQSLFLKTYYPMEFMVAVINNWGGFYSRELYFHELKRAGAILHLPCVNNSEGFTNIRGKEVYMGFCHILGMRQEFMLSLLEQRGKYGEFKHLQDFIERVKLEPEQVYKLIRVGAFRFTGKRKKELLWEADTLLANSKMHIMGNTLFQDEQPAEFTLPELFYDPLDDYMDEIELLGFITGNPFEMVDADLSKFVPADDLEKHLGKAVNIIGYLITTKPVHTIKNETMYFHTFLDPAGNWLDTVHFPQVSNRFPIMGRGFYGMRGIVTEEFGVFSVDVNYCRKMGYKQKVEKVDALLKMDKSYIEMGEPIYHKKLTNELEA